MSQDAIIGQVLPVLLVALLVLVLVFLILRAFWCWYWKINARLKAVEETNRLLADIRAALIQGNTINAVTAGQVVGMANEATGAGSDIPEL